MGAWWSLKFSSTLVLTALLLLFYGSRAAHSSVVHNSTDRRALLDFKEAITVDPMGAFRSWNDSIHHCMWPGVNCSTRHPGRVTVLYLYNMGLAGQITPSLGNLTSLRKLALDSNRLSGQLPPLNRLTSLEELSLGTNLLQGGIPDALTNCSKLKSLNLAFNMLVGSIPGNNLSGKIPQSFSNITRLIEISLADNLLVGSIPEELGQLANISLMFLGGNYLSGSVPATLFNLSYLQGLDLSINMLSGTLPSDVGHMLPNLQFLFLGENKFEGHIPDSLCNASELGRVDLSRNYFAGRIPSYLGKLQNLYYLNLGENKLEARDTQSWEFLSALSHSPLEMLSLYGNQLHGLLPNSVGNLSIMLQQLDLGQNNLFGTVPPTIGKYRNLFSLTLSQNNLTDRIEKWVGTLKNLQGLDLEGNNFVGPIPNSLGNLNKLTSLYLSKNHFDGVLASSLGNCSQLTKLDLSYNNIHGSIPLGMSNLNQLTELKLSSNKLTGEIPNNLDQCDNLITIQMDHNMLIGEIPTSFGNLMALNVLNLSHNNLSGTIPVTLNDLQLLSKLDLSHNHLHGAIPTNGVFRNATSIYLEGNWGLCGGVADLQMPLCSAVSKRSETEYYLVRILVPILGFTSLIMMAYVIILGKNTSRRTYVSFLSFGKKFPRVSYSDLNRATGNFSELNLIGKGSYGSVYRGKLTQAKIQVAIKVFNLDMKCADKSFVTECEVLRSIRHRNLVPILTACSTIDNNGDTFKALVYEFMPNGNLDTWLHNRFLGSSAKQLSLAQRASIAVGIADALAYLHHDCEAQIVHCDLKPTNILLDDAMNAYLGDFGISSLTGHLGSNTSVGLKGTIGYIAPEYAQSGRPSISGDVYSFGIVLLEMLIGKRPTDPLFENELNIVNFAVRNYPDQILHIVDACLDGECNAYIQANIGTEDAAHGCLLSLMQVALSCTRLIPRERMDIREVAARLHSIRTSYIKTTRRDQVMLH